MVLLIMSTTIVINENQRKQLFWALLSESYRHYYRESRDYGRVKTM